MLVVDPIEVSSGPSAKGVTEPAWAPEFADMPGARWWRALLRLSGWGVLPLALLLWAQWPLREVVQAGSRLANDMAQILFAGYAVVAVSAATLGGRHLSAHPAAWLGLRGRVWGLALCLVPWAGWTLWAAVPSVWQSVCGLERFGDTLSPGYFLLRVALALGLMWMLWLALVPLRRWGNRGAAVLARPTEPDA